MMAEKRQGPAGEAPQRRYEDAKAASASAADRISRATQSLLGTFREVYDPEYSRPRDAAAQLVSPSTNPAE